MGGNISFVEQEDIQNTIQPSGVNFEELKNIFLLQTTPISPI
jgi:hypothetical protein